MPRKEYIYWRKKAPRGTLQRRLGFRTKWTKGTQWDLPFSRLFKVRPQGSYKTGPAHIEDLMDNLRRIFGKDES